MIRLHSSWNFAVVTFRKETRQRWLDTQIIPSNMNSKSQVCLLISPPANSEALERSSLGISRGIDRIIERNLFYPHICILFAYSISPVSVDSPVRCSKLLAKCSEQLNTMQVRTSLCMTQLTQHAHEDDTHAIILSYPDDEEATFLPETAMPAVNKTRHRALPYKR